MKLPKPTTEQAAILKDKTPCKIVVAVPGSGKTTLLFHAAKNELQKDGNCLLVSFTKRVETENRIKVEKLFPQHKKNIKVQTFDSFCNNVLVDNWEAAGYSKSPKFESGFDTELFSSVITSTVDNKIQKQIDFSLANKIIERAIRQQTTIKRLLSNPKYSTLKPYYETLKRIKNKYLKRRREAGAIHYSEQVIQCYKLLSNPKTSYILDNLLDYYSLILVDELQDLSPTQLKIALLLSKAKQSYFVGDDAQCIYKFRGVETTNFNTLERKTEHSKRFCLSLSHRCTIPVTAFASRIRATIKDVTAIPMQSHKEGDKPTLITFNNEKGQYTYIAEQIQSLVTNGETYSDIAIIARHHDSLAKLQRFLQPHHIPFNTKYTEDEEQPDIETLYHVVLNVLKLLENGYQEDYIAEVLVFLDVEPTKADYVYLENELTSTNKHVRAYKHPQVKSFASTLLKAKKLQLLPDQIKVIIEFVSSQYKKHIKHYIKSHLTFILVSSKKTETISNLIHFIEALPSYNQDSVSLLTVHASKGLEFSHVFVIDCNDEKFPYQHSQLHYDDVNDELKLFYVAITRCSETLTLTLVEDQYSTITPFVTNLKHWKKSLGYRTGK